VEHASNPSRKPRRPLWRHWQRDLRNISNVLKLHLCLRKLDRTQPQHIALYDPGVGTVTAPVNNTPPALTVR